MPTSISMKLTVRAPVKKYRGGNSVVRRAISKALPSCRARTRYHARHAASQKATRVLSPFAVNSVKLDPSDKTCSQYHYRNASRSSSIARLVTKSNQNFEQYFRPNRLPGVTRRGVTITRCNTACKSGGSSSARDKVTDGLIEGAGEDQT